MGLLTDPLALVCQNPRSQSKESDGKLQITWDNPKELEVYISKLQSAAEKLSTENRKLRKWHTDFIEKVLGSLVSRTFILHSLHFSLFLPHTLTHLFLISWSKVAEAYRHLSISFSFSLSLY